MIIVRESAAALKGFIAKTSLNNLAQAFVLRMSLTVIMHRGRMSCSQAADSIRSLPLPEEADVVVLGDTAYDANVVQQACEDRGCI